MALPAFSYGTDCTLTIDFYTWSTILLVIALVFIWNGSLILWSFPWLADNELFPYLGSSFSAMFESQEYGISIANWKELGKKKIDSIYMSKELKENPTKLKLFVIYSIIFCLNNWMIFVAKLCMFLTLKNHFIDSWKSTSFRSFFNIEISLVSLLMVSNIFFSFAILPGIQLAANTIATTNHFYSRILSICVYLVYLEFFITAILLCIQYPILIAVMYIGACIVLTSMILGMAILCLLFVVIFVGFLVYWTLNALTLCHLSQDKLKHCSSSLTWLFVIYFAWTAGVCLAFLFTTDFFAARMCFSVNSPLELASFLFILFSIFNTIIAMIVVKYIDHKSSFVISYQQVSQGGGVLEEESSRESPLPLTTSSTSDENESTNHTTSTS